MTAHRGDPSIKTGILDRLVGYQVHMVDLIALQNSRDALAAHDTTPATVTAMLFIHDRPGCDQATVGRLLSINRSSAAKFIDRLETKGFVKRSAGLDRRSNGLHLTAAGARHLVEVVALLKKVNASLCRTLDVGEQGELLRLLRKILRSARLEQGVEAGKTLGRKLKQKRGKP